MCCSPQNSQIYGDFWQSCKVLLDSQIVVRTAMNDQNTNRAVPTERNSLKRRALEIFRTYGPLNPPAWATLAKMYPIRSSYSYLLRLHRFGLLNRERDSQGLLMYTISQRGRDRLNWLSNPKPSAIIPSGPNGD